MIWLRSLIFNICFCLWTVIFCTTVSPSMLRFEWLHRMPVYWVSVTLWMLRVICGLRVEIRGRENLSATPVIYASKHQSALDTLVMWSLLGGPTFILKKSLLHVPFFGWYLWRTRPIAIDRGDRAQAMARIGTQAIERVAQGRSVMIFPEGTRTKPGAKVKYKAAGVILLYETLHIPIVPIALNAGMFWGRNAFRKYPGVAVLEVLPAIEPNLPSDVMLGRLKEQIETASMALYEEAKAAAAV